MATNDARGATTEELADIVGDVVGSNTPEGEQLLAAIKELERLREGIEQFFGLDPEMRRRRLLFEARWPGHGPHCSRYLNGKWACEPGCEGATS